MNKKDFIKRFKCPQIDQVWKWIEKYATDARIDENGWWIERYNRKGGIQDDLESIHFHELRIKELRTK